jgi:hypothetical protein
VCDKREISDCMLEVIVEVFLYLGPPHYRSADGTHY